MRPVQVARAISAILTLAAALHAQDVCAPPLPPWLLPSEEDYSKLKDSAQKDVYDRLHYIPVGDQTSYLTVGGQIRQWYESFNTAPLGFGPPGANRYLLQRYMLHLDAHLGDRVRFFVDLKGNLENGRNGGPRPDLDEDAGDIHQAFAELRLGHHAGGSWSLRLGRQELLYGSGRFVDMREGPNVRRSFDGAKLSYCSGKMRVDAFASKPVGNSLNSFDDEPLHGTSFWGLYATRVLPSKRPLSLDVYYFGFDQKDSVYARIQGHEQRHTLGARYAYGGEEGWNADYEAITQFGHIAGEGIRGWAFSTDRGYRFASAAWKPRVGLKLDVASGDSGKRGHDLGSWNPLFASLHYFGEEGLAAPSNFYDVHPEFEAHPRRNVRISLSTNWFWRQKLGDGLYVPGPFPIVQPNGSRAHYVGNLSAIESEWDPSPHWVVTVYYSHFQNGPFIDQAARSSDLNYFAGWVTYHF